MKLLGLKKVHNNCLRCIFSFQELGRLVSEQGDNQALQFMLIKSLPLMIINSHTLTALNNAELTLGTKTKQRVMVLQKMITRATMQNWTLGWSLVRKDTAAPMMHMMPTLYTLIPMYLLSLRAGMLTFLVSHARKQPNNCLEKREEK